MPPKGHIWEASDERDLIMAAWMSTNGGDFKADWNQAHQLMTSWGHTFSKDAISQRWSKKILKDFRARHPESSTTTAAPSSSATATGGRKRSRTVASKTEAGVNDDQDREPKTKKKQATARRAAPKREATNSKTYGEHKEEDGDERMVSLESDEDRDSAFEA